ncbi:MAG TPA: hypothetical protein VNQ99_03575 [Xanthobacteraceae bacterium]|nr:hypothetical protein [Xanthobacteraceae bacterium]
MKIFLFRFFPSNLEQSFENTKKLSDYLGALTRMVFMVPLTMLALVWIATVEPSVSPEYVSLILVTLYFGVLTASVFLSFSWLTAGYVHALMFGPRWPSWATMVITPLIAGILLSALGIVIYEISENSVLLKDAVKLGEKFNPD